MAGRTGNSSSEEDTAMKMEPTEESEDETNRIMKRWAAEKITKKAETMRRQKRTARMTEGDHVDIDFFTLAPTASRRL